MITRQALREQVLASSWEDLAPHLARGGLLLLAADQDLLDAALAVANDDAASVQRLVENGHLVRAVGGHAEEYAERKDVRFQLVIVQPYVLAQEIVHRDLAKR